MIESIFSFTLIFLVVIQGSYLLTSEWKRHRCQVFLFQNLRSQLEQNPSSLLPLTHLHDRQLIIHDNPTTLEGTALCGKIKEQLRLPKL